MGIDCCQEEGLLTINKSLNNNNITDIKDEDLHESYPKDGKFVKKSILGKGAYGEVRKIVSTESNIIYALKETSLNSFKNVKSFIRENKILSKCNHPNIIDFKEIFKDMNTETINMILEYAKGGTLEQQIKGEKHIEEKTLIFWFLVMEITTTWEKRLI